MSKYLDLLRRARAELDESSSGPTEKEPQSECAAPLSPAETILTTCATHGVAIRFDPDGTIVVGRAGALADENSQPWPALIAAIEAHLDAVAKLVEAGWHLRVGFPSPAEEREEP